jgi:prepilin-type N-terminal cleavage/methylation domain-containing protein
MKHTSGQRGFTIIEVLIVLTIASMILLIIFWTVPALNRSSRNSNRKQAVRYVASELDNYYLSNGKYPLSGTSAAADKRTAFVSTLQANGPTKLFDIRYTDEGGSHEYPYNTYDPTWALDEISIESGHKCNRTAGVGPGDTDFPLQTARGGDSDFKAYVVWTTLEGASVYCIDNAYN